ncbi:hypothetical protein GE061_016047 [Apolygus lucorum]|uniref:Uncharacterized protein n=1 Tax=Apolygus lucorum TaxID=248454 RepID=A0A8S9XEW5_APOLU|nr:hypothetical protein GE061_016047 [Apolygus lucorum]
MDYLKWFSSDATSECITLEQVVHIASSSDVATTFQFHLVATTIVRSQHGQLSRPENGWFEAEFWRRAGPSQEDRPSSAA